MGECGSPTEEYCSGNQYRKPKMFPCGEGTPCWSNVYGYPPEDIPIEDTVEEIIIEDPVESDCEEIEAVLNGRGFKICIPKTDTATDPAVQEIDDPEKPNPCLQGYKIHPIFTSDGKKEDFIILQIPADNDPATGKPTKPDVIPNAEHAKRSIPGDAYIVRISKKSHVSNKRTELLYEFRLPEQKMDEFQTKGTQYLLTDITGPEPEKSAEEKVNDKKGKGKKGKGKKKGKKK